MPYTQADIDILKEAIATGASEVRFADGRFTRFRSLDEMKRILADMMEEVAPQEQRRHRASYATFERD